MLQKSKVLFTEEVKISSEQRKVNDAQGDKIKLKAPFCINAVNWKLDKKKCLPNGRLAEATKYT